MAPPAGNRGCRRDVRDAQAKRAGHGSVIRRRTSAPAVAGTAAPDGLVGDSRVGRDAEAGILPRPTQRCPTWCGRAGRSIVGDAASTAVEQDLRAQVTKEKL